MDSRLIIASLALPLAFAAGVARADIYTCRNAQGNLSIQDRPCGSGGKTQKVYRDTEPRASRRGGGGSAKSSAAPKELGDAVVGGSTGSSGGVPVGLKNERNKGVICGLLAAEKQEALDQIAGKAPPPAGEDPADNLQKIERQLARVACTQ